MTPGTEQKVLIAQTCIQKQLAKQKAPHKSKHMCCGLTDSNKGLGGGGDSAQSVWFNSTENVLPIETTETQAALRCVL